MEEDNTDVRAPIPYPKRFVPGDREREFIPLVCSDPALTAAAETFLYYLKRLYGTAGQSGENAHLRFMTDGGLSGEEYRVKAAEDGVRVYASSLAGASHGASVVLQLLRMESGKLYLRDFEAHDYPDSDWRGVMLDLARSAYPAADILAYADLCYFYRLSVLHLHFADGPENYMYKLPSEHFPKLSETASYTREEVRRIAEYVSARGVTLVPEIEMPAHMEPLVHYYPEIFGGHVNIMCVSEKAFGALDTMIGEVCGLFPESPYIHVGCDEATYAKWDACPDCRAFMAEHGIASGAELYTYVCDRVTRMVLAHGRRPVLWEGFPRQGSEKMSRDVLVMVFESKYQNAKELTAQGFRVINASWQPLYVVPPYPIFWSPQEIYKWNTCRWLFMEAKDDSGAIDVTGEHVRDVAGAEMCVWSSVDYDKDKKIMSVNLPALAERSWNRQAPLSFGVYDRCAAPIRAKIGAMLEIR